MGSRIPDRSINEGGGTRTHTLEALVPKTNAAAITPLPRFNRGNGTWTHTSRGPRILSPVCLPIPAYPHINPLVYRAHT